MGILRTDRITGLGGANAITGSVFLGGKQRIVIDSHDDFNFSNNDFTLECWINFSGFNGDGFDTIAWGGSDGTAATRSIQWDYKNTSNQLRLVTSVSDSGTVYASSFTALKDVWYHLAVCRSSSDLKLFVNGTQIGSTHNIGSNVIDYDTVPFNIGMRPGNDDRGVIGHISNFRIINGTALYTSNFSVPTTRLTSVTNTALLCCQSSGNIFEDQSLVKKRFTFHTNNTNDAPPLATKFTPNSPVGFSTTTDVGSQYGATFDGFGNFATSTYMVPPAGNTRERNRGRAVMPVGARSPYLSILGLDIQSEGISQDFGDLRQEAQLPGSASSSTRMLVTMGYTAPAQTNTIDFITIANIASSEDFGDLTEARRRTQSLSNSTRAVHVGGTGTPADTPYFNTMDFNTIATLGNSTDFGDSSAASTAHGGSVASSTRGIYNPALVNSSYVNSLEFITIATTGNGQDFGDLSLAKGYYFRGSICDTTRGLFAGGYNPVQDTIEFVTMATTGNSTDFGNLTVARRGGGGTSNSIKSVFMGGYLPGVGNVIDSVIIQTTGNAKDFGDLIVRTHDTSSSSDSHGGL